MDKLTRMHTVTPTFENGFVYLPERAPWLSQYVHELVTFPHAQNATIRPTPPLRPSTG